MTAPGPAAIRGIDIGVAAAGMRYAGRDDTVVFALAQGTGVAAVFTRNRFPAAPVTIAARHLAAAAPRYWLINAGNANAATGQQGIADALASCRHLAAAAKAAPEAVLPFSTGVIGEAMPMTKFKPAIDRAFAALAPDHWPQAAAAIMTTDTHPKLASETFSINGELCHIIGIAKGAGMIHPDMATMLAFIGTDAHLPQPLLRQSLRQAVAQSFNQITIDGDTSTNDACAVAATGQGALRLTEPGPAYAAFSAKLAHVCARLAESIVRDGEGATKLARIHVRGGRDQAQCKSIATTIALSPLVKTALNGEDPNWGRILAALGRAPAAFDPERVALYLGDMRVFRRGQIDPNYHEPDAAATMRRAEVAITIDLNAGAAAATVLTSDLSADYVRINADYRS